MHVTAPARKLLNAMAACVRAAGKDGIYTISANVGGAEEKICIEGTTPLITRRIRIEADVHEPGAFMTDGNLALRYIKGAEIDAAVLDIKVEKNGGGESIVIGSQTGAARLGGKRPVEYIGDENNVIGNETIGSGRLSIGTQEDFTPLSHAIALAKIHATPETQATPALSSLSGVQISIDQGRLRVRGSDGKRMIEIKLNISQSGALFMNGDVSEAVIPGSAIAILCETLKKRSGSIRIENSTLYFQSDVEDLDIRLLEAPYPSARFNPSDLIVENKINLQKTRLGIAIARSGSVLEGGRKGPLVRIERTDDGVYLASSADRIATAEKISDVGGENTAMSIDGKHLGIAIGSMEGEEIVLSTTKEGPVIVSNPGNPHMIVVLTSME